MRIDPDTCRDPDLLSAEVRRLQAAMDAGPVTLTDAERKAIKTTIGGMAMWIAQNDLAEDESLRLAVVTLRGLLERTDDRRRPQQSTGESDAIGGSSVEFSPFADRESDRPHPIAYCDNDRSQPIADAAETNPKPPRNGTPAECSVPPEWMARPFYVDPPSGWQYGFPRLYDPAADGDMTEWMIRCGYPEKLARQGLPCTFTAAVDHS